MHAKTIDITTTEYAPVVVVSDSAGTPQGPLTLTATAAVSGGAVLKASAGVLNDFNFTSGASAGYLMFFNSTTVPADGAVTPLMVFTVAANATIDNQLRFPRRFTTGISWAFSTTGPFAKAVSATAFMAASVT